MNNIWATNSSTACLFIQFGKNKKTPEPLRLKGFKDDSDWSRTSDLHPVKVALSQLSYGIVFISVGQYLVYKEWGALSISFLKKRIEILSRKKGVLLHEAHDHPFLRDIAL
jgi:hypothetical protein